MRMGDQGPTILSEVSFLLLRKYQKQECAYGEAVKAGWKHATDSRLILSIFVIHPPLPSTAAAMASVKRQRLGEGPAAGRGGRQSRGRWFSSPLFSSSSSFYSWCVFLAI